MRETLFEVSTSLGFETVQQESQRFNLLLKDKSVTHIKLALQGVEHCDSAGVALLIDIKRQAQRHKKQVVFDQLSKPIAAMAKFCGVEGLLC